MPTSLEAFEAKMSSRSPTATFSPADSGLSSFWGAEPDIVNDKSALTLSAFWAGVTLISEAMASMPVQVWKKRKGGGFDLADQHPSNYCLTKTNNGWMTPAVFTSLGQSSCLMGGNFVCEVIRNGRGQATELHHWLNQNVHYGTDTNGNPMYGVIGSNVDISDVSVLMERRTYLDQLAISWFPYQEILHIKGFSTNGFIGMKVLDAARMNLGTALIMEQFQRRYFQKGRPAGFISSPQKMTQEQLEVMRKEWKELYETASQAGRVGILHGGLDWKSMGYTNDDAQLLQNKNFSVLDVARWLRVPPHMLAELSKATEVNIEHLMLEFITFTLLPWITRWEEEMNLKLFTPMEQFSYGVFFDVDAFLRGDKLTKAKVEETEIRNGKRTIEECRLADRLNPYDEVDGVRPGSRPLIMASQLDLLKNVEDGTSLLHGKPAEAGAPKASV